MDTPSLNALIIEGNVTVATNVSVTIHAAYIIVYATGYFWIGQRNAPHPAGVTATLMLDATRETPDWAINNDLNLGSKVCGLGGGSRD